MGTNRSALRVVLAAGLGAVGLPAGGCMKADPGKPAPAAAGTTRERVAALALRQVDFGAISLIPVRFEKSRIAGPFEDGGRILYCVTSHMTGRSFGKGERPKAVIRDEGGVLTILRDENEVCEGHRTEPFTELDSAKG
ncbi:hypothetical protein [Methylobacterium gnaphalii]|uniref:Lipoprotein n=1 Tax=Methylobacterium gnaphalii TaxID=1010610 RepID=A0A512JEX9_9HYPH|nr:hypothetical protein MGN01_03390 [Methylobacterium gnaphalii]GJD71080.1 hypothetical protein MMMDOFMJ_4034 [Methylobacterium gnaphalii]